MSPRHYRSDRRQVAARETRRRIVESAVRLHAERGAIATTYAMIAKRANVAIPTVYNHFPSLGELLVACTGQAALHAPHIGPDLFDNVDNLRARLHVLVDALIAHHDYYAPWMRWAANEAEVLPELAKWRQYEAEARRELIAAALRPAFGKSPPPALMALCEILTGFPAWQTLASKQSPLRAKAETILVETLALLMRHHGGGGSNGSSFSKRKLK